MRKFIRLAALVTSVALFATELGVAKDAVKVNWNRVAREYCHLLRFPRGWQMPNSVVEKDGKRYSPPKFSLAYDYEFRVAGLLGTKFLVRGVEEIIYKYYTNNIYEVDLSDPKTAARPASEGEWNLATVLPVTYGGNADALAEFMKALPYQFGSSGDHDERVRMSPDRSLLVSQSWSGRLAPGGSDVPLDTSNAIGLNRGKLFFNVYNTDTGKKLTTIAATFVGIYPEQIFGKSGFLTERYFLIPMDERRERCLVCEFGRMR